MCAYILIICSPSQAPFINWWPDHTNKFGPGPALTYKPSSKKKVSGLVTDCYIAPYSWWGLGPSSESQSITIFSCPQIQSIPKVALCGFLNKNVANYEWEDAGLQLKPASLGLLENKSNKSRAHTAWKKNIYKNNNEIVDKVEGGGHQMPQAKVTSIKQK